ncbi:SspB family protein [Candidatus Liberibacter brunswickensis]|uniref:SspB family protein n=1 Tax=Candidatus Liberibacter brunswickensis TaxID=1968796 RepID=UPI002FE09742
MNHDHIRYDILAKEALRGLVKNVLSETASIGSLPGEHHFYITFATNARGVRISQNLRKSYPEKMTIVIQNQFWDLKVFDHHFEIGLSFSNIPERLSIPFNSIKGFYDPSVNFELEFDINIDKTEEDIEKKTCKIIKTSDSFNNKSCSSNKNSYKDKNKKQDKSNIASVISLDNFRKK